MREGQEKDSHETVYENFGYNDISQSSHLTSEGPEF